VAAKSVSSGATACSTWDWGRLQALVLKINIKIIEKTVILMVMDEVLLGPG
jgi:hypothetical protein